VTYNGPQFRHAVRELTLAAIAARSVLFVRSAQFCLIPGWRRRGRLFRRALNVTSHSLIERMRFRKTVALPPLD